MREDPYRPHSDHATRNMAVLRSMALNLPKHPEAVCLAMVSIHRLHKMASSPFAQTSGWQKSRRGGIRPFSASVEEELPELFRSQRQKFLHIGGAVRTGIKEIRRSEG